MLADTNEVAPQSTTMHRLIHDRPDCDFWSENAAGMNLSHDGELLVLEFFGMKLGDWGSDEAPNCPQCGKNLYIEEPDGHLVEPKVWFEQVEIAECDACGHMGELDAGESYRETVHAAMIDPPDESWICAGCVAQFESAEEDRMMDIEPGMTDQDYYLYEK